MKDKKVIYQTTLFLMLISVCLFLAGCPNRIDTNSISNGEYYESTVGAVLIRDYNAFCNSKTPVVSIIYYLPDGTRKEIEFELDGYDEEKQIGYKLVSIEDIKKWTNSKKEGSNSLDIDDMDLIQEACLKYQFPIIFLSIYQYQDEVSDSEIVDNKEDFNSEINSLLSTKEIKQWAEKGLYNGDWIKESIDKYAFESFNINFNNLNLPVVEIMYGENKKASFQLDGFDQTKQLVINL